MGNCYSQRLPEYWQERIKAYALKVSDGKYEDCSAGLFEGNVRLIFPDQSHCFFKHACFVIDEERREILVLTEHCGYHLFPYSADLDVEYCETKWQEIDL